jgi:hypothetical protein
MIAEQFQKYLEAVKEWKRRNGLNGGGGEFNHTTRIFKFASKPTPEQFDLDLDKEPWLKAQAEKMEKEL